MEVNVMIHFFDQHHFELQCDTRDMVFVCLQPQKKKTSRKRGTNKIQPRFSVFLECEKMWMCGLFTRNF